MKIQKAILMTILFSTAILLLCILFLFKHQDMTALLYIWLIYAVAICFYVFKEDKKE